MNFNIKAFITIKTFLVAKLRFIHELKDQEYTRYLLVTLASIGLLIGGCMYFIYSTCSNLDTEIVKLQNSKKKTRKMLLDFATIDAEETRLRAVLEQHKKFNLTVYFEEFCKNSGFSATPGWSTTATVINPQVDEIALTATFKSQTTESLVRMLQIFDKTEIIYIKNLHIKSEPGKKITCEITLATVKTKMG